MQLSEVTKLMPFLTILDVRSREEVIIRLAGTAIFDALGEELTGRNYLDLTTPDVRPIRSARLWLQTRHPCGAVMRNVHNAGTDAEVHLEILSLPIRPLREEEPIQLLSVVGPLGSENLTTDEAHIQVARIAHEFHYVGIGAGVPDVPSSDLLTPGP